jgi:hypothetical protein
MGTIVVHIEVETSYAYPRSQARACGGNRRRRAVVGENGRQIDMTDDRSHFAIGPSWHQHKTRSCCAFLRAFRPVVIMGAEFFWCIKEGR